MEIEISIEGRYEEKFGGVGFWCPMILFVFFLNFGFNNGHTNDVSSFTIRVSPRPFQFDPHSHSHVLTLTPPSNA